MYQNELDNVRFQHDLAFGDFITASDGAAKSGIMLNQQLAEELHNSVIRKFEKRKVYSC